jgi:bifunctional non-homologous end joining protein LigD
VTARKGALPDFIEPELCRIVPSPPRGERWIHEVKLDGYRMQLRVERGHSALRTRKSLDWSARFPEIVREAQVLSDCIVDGEVAALDEDGLSSFADLQAALSDGDTAKLVYFAFDLLFLEGSDLRNEPLAKRKQALKQLLRRDLPKSRRIRFVDTFKPGAGEDPFDSACRLKLEGLISKRADAPYRSGRSDDWVKSKCRAGQEVVIGGWWGDSSKLRSLLVGVHYQGQFVYLGRVGTGFNTRSASEVLARLKPLEQPRTPFAPHAELPRGSGIHWVRPQVVAEIEFGTFTTAGLLRQASFKGLREDKPARSVVPEPQPAAARQGSETMASKSKTKTKITTTAAVRPSAKQNLIVAGIAISHPDKVLWPATGAGKALTKADLARYYEMAAPRILPHVAGRPISIVRAPDGIGGQRFFQRHLMQGSDRHLLPVKVSGEKEPYITVTDTEGLVALAQAAVLELHPWGSKPGEPDVPARIIFDLDPAPDVAFDDVIQAAKDMGARLKRLGFTPFVKTTGGKGLHVVVAIKGTPKKPATWADAKSFARDVCRQMEEEEPRRFTTNMSKSVRGGKIFLDFLRNDKTSTAVAPWSPRARAGAPVSVPLPWSKLKKGLDPQRFTLADGKSFLRGADPWKDIDRTALALSTARKKLDGS